MDERDVWDATVAGETAAAAAADGDERPLTRRELRERRTGVGQWAERPEVPAEQGPTGEQGRVEEQGPAEEQGDPQQATAGAWDLAVDWSLHSELPRELPPEPDVDDVRWDPVVPIGGAPSRVPVAGRWPTVGGGRAQTGWGEPVTAAAPTTDEDQADGGQDVRAPDGTDRDGTDHAGTGHDGTDDDGTDHAGTDHDGSPDAPFEAVTQRLRHVPETPAGQSLPAPDATAAAPDVLPWSADQAPAGPAGAAMPFPQLIGTIGAERTAGVELPTLSDLLAARPAPPAGPAELGWQSTLRRMTGGLVSPGPGRAEQRHRAAVATVQRSLTGPKTIVVINPKGGAHKTTASLMIAATFGQHRGGYTLAWDNNETRGTLGWRSHQSRHHNTAVNLLQDLDRFADPGSARVGDLDNYVRSQGSAQFDVLASDEDAASAASIDAFAFRALHRTLSRFYRVMVIDTGNNMRASNWQAAIQSADQVVIVSTVREDTAQSAAWAVDALRATGHDDIVRRAVTVLSAPAPRRDDELARRLHEHFGRLTRTVLDVPYDPALVAGSPLEFEALSDATREAWLHVTATVAEGL